MESDDILKLLSEFDMFWIAELKTDSDVHVPGYQCFRNDERYSTHGGVALFVKYYLINDIKEVRYVRDDAVLVSFKSAPDVLFSGWYVPPSDSRYADNHVFATMSSLLCGEERSMILVGDFNAKIQDRNAIIKNKSFTYTSQVHPQNLYGETMLSIAKRNNLVLLNGLNMGRYSFDDSLTYRKRNEWISRLDLLFCSENMLKSIKSFKVMQGNCCLPSDHAILSCSLTVPHRINLEMLSQRALWLNHYEVPIVSCKRGIKYSQIDSAKFVSIMENVALPELNINNLDNCVDFLAQHMYEGAENSLLPSKVWDTELERWRRLMKSDSPKDIWLAINWKGELNKKENKSSPSPGEFKNHFEKLLLASETENLTIENLEDNSPYIPLLDDPISTKELETAMYESNPNKACDRKGNSPGVTRLLNPAILLFILQMFNLILQSSRIPVEWTLSKLITLFKRGKTSLCGNYRGIAINDILFRLYDKILGKRLSLWYQPYREQAGGQKERDCIEHIMTLRLLIDYARKTRQKLFILFIDFEKAYDKVRRDKLFELLRDAGCGKLMLLSLQAIYKNTKFLFKTVLISANLGVKQGSSASCILFILYVDRMIKMVKTAFLDDGFLGSLHMLMLMDDTVLFATSREKLIEKFQKCQDFCAEYGMSINQKKTEFMVINNNKHDKKTIQSRGIYVKYSGYYKYLGAPITDNGSYLTMMNLHAKDKLKHTIKYYTFLNRNPDIPFSMKRKVAEACVLSAMLYGAETWFTNNFGKIDAMYTKIVKALLDVRNTTCNDTCLIEADMPSLQALVRKKMQSYLQMKIPKLEHEDPLWKALELARSANTKSYRFIQTMLEDDSKILEEDKSRREEELRLKSSISTKRATYMEMNPLLQQHKVYKNDEIDEFKRIEFTRYRLSSHNLKVETGRWGRIEQENRTCSCTTGGVQNEPHVLFKCDFTNNIRAKYDILGDSVEDLFNTTEDQILCNIFYDLSKIFSR